MKRPLSCPHWLAALLLLSAGVVQADTYRLAVQPFLPADEIRATYEPLARYLSQASGHEVQLVTALNFMAYWQTMRRGQYDLVLDGPHFTDYRAQRMNYTVLAKVRDSVSYSLVTLAEAMIMDPAELVTRSVATTPAPSYGALLLGQIYPNQFRLPRIVEVSDSTVAIQKVLSREADAAFVPTPMVGHHAQLHTVSSTAQFPHMALSAAPRVPTAVQSRIREALVDAQTAMEGRSMLAATRTPGFELTSGDLYRGYLALLAETWGY